MAAARAGSVPAVRLLLARGVDVNAAEKFQKTTALMWAAAEGHVDVVDLLLKAGADPNRQAHVTSLTERHNADHPTGGFTALMWAARNGNEAMVRRLLARGANLNLKNGDDASATMIAIYNDRFDMAATLVELGADVNDGSLYVAVEMRESTTDQFAFDGSRLRPDQSEHADGARSDEDAARARRRSEQALRRPVPLDATCRTAIASTTRRSTARPSPRTSRR